MGAAEVIQQTKQDVLLDNTEISTKVSLEQLADLTGFPISTVKKELLLDSDEIELDSLREVMLSYLAKNFN